MRFPPEPNGYLHIGHAKSICLNFGLARDYGGVCHLRFDDTNPEKEEQEYVDGILRRRALAGLRHPLADNPANRAGQRPLYFASNYFDFMYRAAEYLIEAGLAYVDEQSAEQMRANRGDFNTPGTDSPFRGRTPDENLAALPRHARRQAGRRRRRAARQDRHGEPQHQPARPGAVPHPPRHAPQHRRQVVHLPDVHLRAPDRGRAGEHHPQHLHAGVRGPAAVLRLAAGPAGRRRPDRHAASAPVRIRAAEPDLRDHQQAQAEASWSRRTTSSGWDDPRMPTIVGPAPPRLHARGAAAVLPSASASPSADGWIDYASARGRAARRPGPEGAARDGGAGPGQAGHHELGRADGRDGFLDACTAPVHPHHPERGQRELQVRPRGLDRAHRLRGRAAQGLLPPVPRQQGAAEVRPRRSSARARTRDASGSAAGSAGRRWCPTPRAARRARTRSRSRATSPGWRRPMRCRPKCACTTACSRRRSPAAANCWKS